MGLGEFGCHPRVTDGWTVHLRERRRHVGRSVWSVRVTAKPSPGREVRGTEGKSRKARRAQPVTHWPLDQLLTHVGSKMSLKLPRNWDFNLKVETVKIARSRSVMTGEQMAAFHPPTTPNPLERPIKMGWLKKQRSIVKNWQQRYFVLKARQLYYYKDEEDSKPQGCMYLPGSTVKEIATNPEEAGKFVFEVIPASSDQNRTGQDSYVLMASSQVEMEEWVKFLRRVAGTPSGAVFGQRLDETVAYEQKFGPHLVPILVEKCSEFILEHGVSEEGIFRLPGQDNLVKQLRDAFDAGERPSFDRCAVLKGVGRKDLVEPGGF